MHVQSILMSSKCDTLRAAFGMESSGTNTHLKPSGGEPGAIGPDADGGVANRTLVSESAAPTPFLMAAKRTQYVSAKPIAAASNGSSRPKPIIVPIPESPSCVEASILAEGVQGVEVVSA